MINIVQLSDLHFGTNDPYITQVLQKTVIDLSPDIVVVSGDLTTRARAREFSAAKEFLEPLPGERIIVPGNHDVSLYNIFRRFFKPLTRFTQIMEKEVDTHFMNEGVVVIGLNSSRSFTIKGGDISSKQIEKVKAILDDVPANVVKIVVTHHPMQTMDSDIEQNLIALGIDVFVSGHMHKSESVAKKIELNGGTREVVFVRAGTATSVRYRNEPNSFNLLSIESSNFKVLTYTWSAKEAKFEVVNEKSYVLT